MLFLFLRMGEQLLKWLLNWNWSLNMTFKLVATFFLGNQMLVPNMYFALVVSFGFLVILSDRCVNMARA